MNSTVAIRGVSLRYPAGVLLFRQGAGFRFSSTAAASSSSKIQEDILKDKQTAGPPLSRLSTKTLLRSLGLTSLMRRRWIMTPSLAILNFMVGSKTRLLDFDRNPVLNKLTRWLLYNQFAAGATRQEVAKTASELRGMGYQGIILGYAREVLLDKPDEAAAGSKSDTQERYQVRDYQVIEEWKQGNLETLSMLQPGDFLAVKITGAGPVAVDAMKLRSPMPKAVADAMDDICVATKKAGCRLWIDAEQQGLQPALDDWTIEMMRKYNRDGASLVYNTIQAYLKGARANAQNHIRLAAKEGWTVAVKLVRGAYIQNEIRTLIHDTKSDTDRSYDEIADYFISQRLPETPGKTENKEPANFPSAALFLATHNMTSAEKAVTMYMHRKQAGLPTVQKMECGQLQGMADELSCKLLQRREDNAESPGVLKCLVWGSVSECIGNMQRRAVENRDAIERTQSMVAALKKELRRRMFA